MRDADPARLTLHTHSADGTRAVAARLGARLQPGDLILLEGGLGAGKTAFVQGLARGMGLAAAVKSPTFTLVHEYRPPRGADGPRPHGLAHLDLYRIPEGRDVSDLALDELLETSAVAVEWGSRLAAKYRDHVSLVLSSPDGADPAAADERVLQFEGHGPRGRALVEALAVEPGPLAEAE